jgi:hypothetical protein
MQSLDWWLVGFGLRCCALVFAELGCFLFLIPTLVNAHSDAALFGAVLLALAALFTGFVGTVSLSREVRTLMDRDQ